MGCRLRWEVRERRIGLFDWGLFLMVRRYFKVWSYLVNGLFYRKKSIGNRFSAAKFAIL